MVSCVALVQICPSRTNLALSCKRLLTSQLNFSIPNEPYYSRSFSQVSRWAMLTKKPNASANGKRKVAEDSVPSNKRPKAPDKFSEKSRYKDSTREEEYGIVLRDFYPPEMTNERAKQYVAGVVERPIKTLEKAIAETRQPREKAKVKDAVVHWFKCDLRTRDNKALHMASKMAKSKGVPLIGIYLVSPQDFQAHLTSAVRVDFILRTLDVLKADLAELDIPLHVEVVEKRKRIPDRIIELSEKWGANHVFCNTEYEVDELRREAALTRDCLERGIAFTTVPDTCVVSPGELSSKGTGGQFAVYSPWFRAWCAYINSHQSVLDEYSRPEKNPAFTRERFKDLFECVLPDAPANKQLSAEEKKRFRSMWPPGEHEAAQRLEKFINQRIQKYSETRNIPAGNNTAVISVHLASGTLAARTCIREARNANTTRSMDAGNPGIQSWISEIAWRDFYKHVLAHWPFIW
jgi:deoxyribodipyrimidine photo-lyase